MLATGTIDPVARTFDILSVSETNTSISTINNLLKLSYTSENGELVQLVKEINPSDDVKVVDKLQISPVTQGGYGGYGQRGGDDNGVATALTSVNWAATGSLTTKTFTDDNGVTRTAVLLPVLV